MKINAQEFEGPGSLAEAGRTLLEDPALDLVVVRNLVSPLQRDNPAQSLILKAPDKTKLYKQIPELEDLDTVVGDWWEAHPLIDFKPLKSMIKDRFRLSGVRPHIDFSTNGGSIEGPLSLSLRLDNSSQPRTFYARRVPGTIVHGQQLDIEALSKLNNRYGANTKSGEFLWRHRAGTRVEQRPGDGILFPNPPLSPSVHGVRTGSYDKTLSAIFTYMFQSTESVQNTNSG